MKHLILTEGHAGEIEIDNEMVYLQYGKQSVDGLVKEGVQNRYIVDQIASVLWDKYGITDDYIHIISSGQTDSTMKLRRQAANMIVRKIGAKDAIMFEPHLNASGMGVKWKDACGHKIFHNGRYNAKEGAIQLDDALINGKPLKTMSRGIKKKYFIKVLCEAYLGELYFQTNKKESFFYRKPKNMGKLCEVVADALAIRMQVPNARN